LRALVIEALAAALQLAPEDLRRAIMFAGDFPAVVEAVAAEGEVALRRFGPRPLVPIEPMLASVAPSAGEAVAALGAAAVEWKLDGVRIQLHRDGDVVRAYSRQLRDVSALVPEVIALGRGFSATRFILDGEVVAFDRDQRPLAFQDLMSRFSTERDTTNEAPAALEVPLVPLFFDLLFLDEAPLVDRPYRERRSMLEQVVPEAHRVPAAVAASSEEAEHLYSEALGRGHEGVVVKSLEAPYTAGRRGAHWQKVKPAVTLDLVILAVEWGHGRRSGLLSNLHLGARVAGEPDRFVMLGKTFKGLTDEMLRSMTEDLLALETHRDGIVVFVRPERVVEIAFDAVQRSPRYDSGFALRFARVKRFRPDKRPEEAATLDEVLAAGESGRKS
jgi:ATP-dependent DNA ligase I